MNPEAIVALIGSIISVASAALRAGQDAAPFAKLIYNDIVGKPVSDVDQADVEAKLAVLSASIQQPLDPEEPDET